MAFENRTGGKYFTIFGGRFAIRVGKDTEGAVERVNKMGNTVYEIFHDSFTGLLVGLRKKEGGEYGPQWEFDFRDGTELYTLQLPYSNSYSKNLLKILPNADLTKEMKVQPSQKIEGDKTKPSIFVSQNGTTLKHAYTKDNAKGMPEMVQKTVSGKLVWDDTDQLLFLEEMAKRDIIPNLPKDAAAAPAAAGVGASAEDEDF